MKLICVVIFCSLFVLCLTTQFFVGAIDITDCPGGVKVESGGGNIGTTTVSGAALTNCDLTIENTETTGIDFTGPVNNVNITIRNIVCTNSANNAECVKFSSTISNAHNLIFENITDTHTIAGGSCNVVMIRYVGTVNGVSGAWSHRNSAMKVTSSSGSGGTSMFAILLEDDVSNAASIDFSGLSLQPDVSDSTSIVNAYLVLFKKSVTLQGTTTASSALTFSNNSMKGSSVSASSYAMFAGIFFGDTSTRTYSGISRLVVDGLDMSNSSVTSTGSYIGWYGIYFQESTTLSMVHDANITIKGVQLGGSASAAATGLYLYRVVFQALLNANSILVSDSQTDFSSGDGGATTTGASTPICAWSVYFVAAVSDIDSITVRNTSIAGKYSTAGSSAYVDLRVLRIPSTVTNVSKITVSDSVIHPANASSSQSYISSLIAHVTSSVSGNSADSSNSALTFNRNSIRGTMTASTFVHSAIAWFDTSATVTDSNSVTVSDNAVSASVTSSTSYVEAYIVYFKNSVTLQGTTSSSALILSNNSMKGSSISASGYAYFMGAFFGDGNTRTYSGISKFVVDGLDMSNSSVASSTNSVTWCGVYFVTSTTLSMVHDGNVTIKGVQLGGLASAAATALYLHIVAFRALSSVNSMLVADSQMDLSYSDGATTTGASTYIQAWSVSFVSAISDIDSITVHNASIRGIYSTAGSSAYIALRVLDLRSTVTSVSKITVSGSTIHPTSASSSQSSAGSFIADFSNTISGNSADSSSALTFSGNSIRGTMTADGSVDSDIVWFGTGAAVTDYNTIAANDNIVRVSMTSATSRVETYVVYFKNSVTLQGTASSVLTLSNNSMKGSIVSASSYMLFIGLRFGDSSPRTYSGISKFVVDGLDMGNSSVRTSTSYVSTVGVWFMTGSSLSMVHDGNVTIKGVVLGGSANAGTTMFLYIAFFRALTNVHSILVADSQMDFSDGDGGGGGATSEGSSSSFRAWTVYFAPAISNIESIVVHNNSIGGKYEAETDVELRVLHMASAVTNVSRITVRASSIHPTRSSSSSQGVADSFVAFFTSSVSGNSADSSSALTFNHNSIRGTMAVNGSVESAIVWFDTSATVTDYSSVTVSDNAVSASMTSSGSTVKTYIMRFQPSITLQGAASSALIFSNNSMKGSSVSASNEVHFMGAYFGQGSTRTYGGISKFVIDGLDMRNSSVTSTASSVAWLGAQFFASATLSMVHDANITIKGVLLGGAASAAAEGLTLRVVKFRALSNVKSIRVADSQMDFSSGDGGATTTGASTYVWAGYMTFRDAISGVDSITIHNTSITGVYSATGSNGYVTLRVLYLKSAATNVSNIVVTDSIIHPTDASSSQSYVDTFVAMFSNTVSGNSSADSSGALTFKGNSIRGTMAADGSVESAIVWFDTNAAVTDYSSVTVSGNAVSASMTSSASYVEAYIIYFKNSATLQGAASSVLTLSNNSMKGSIISANSYVLFIGLRFGDGNIRSYSGISKLVVDGVDMSNSSLASTTSFAGSTCVYFETGAALSMVHDGNVTIKGVQLGGSASAAGTGLSLKVVVFRALTNVNSILVADSQTDFSSGDGAATTGASTPIWASSVQCFLPIFDVDSITVRNVSITGKYSTVGSSAYVNLRTLVLDSTVINVSKITVTDSTLHPTSASSTQSYVNSFVAYFANTVSGNSADSDSALTFNRNSIRGTMTADDYVHSAVVWFTSSAIVTDYNSIVVNSCTVRSTTTSSASYVKAYTVYVGNSVTLQGTASSALTFSNNSMKGSVIAAKSLGYLMGLWLGNDNTPYTYSGISTFVVHGLDMSNSTVTSSTSYVDVIGVYFAGPATLSMVPHDGNITVKGVLLGGSASAAGKGIYLYVILFKSFANVSTIVVADSRMDFGSGEGATTTGASTYIRAWAARFVSAISDIASLTVRNISITGKYSTAGSGAYAELVALHFQSTVTNVSKITVTDSTIHPTEASSSQSYANGIIANFYYTVSGNIADSSSALTFSRNTIRGTMTASSSISAAVLWCGSGAAVADYNSITANDSIVRASMTSATSRVETYVVYFKNSVTLQGTASSALILSNNSMKGSVISADNYVRFIGVLFGDGPTRTYSGISKFVVDGLDMNNSSVASSSNAVRWNALYFTGSATTLKLVYHGNINIKGVLLGGSASAAGTSLTLHVVVFKALANIKSINVEDSAIDFSSSGDDTGGATTTGSSVDLAVWPVEFNTAVSGVDAVTVRNNSVAGVFSASGSGAYISLRIFRMHGTVSSISKITVSDSTVHPTSASSSQSYVNMFIAYFSNTVSGDSNTSLLAFNGNAIRGTATASTTMQSAIVWFPKSVVNFNSITANDNTVSASMTSTGPDTTLQSYVVFFQNSVLLHDDGGGSSTLHFLRNSMAHSTVRARRNCYFHGVRFGDGSTRSYSGISKLVVDGLDMTNCSVVVSSSSSSSSTTTSAIFSGVVFEGSSTLNMVQQGGGDVTIKGVLLSGSASAASGGRLLLRVVQLSVLSNVKSILVANSSIHFFDDADQKGGGGGSGDGSSTATIHVRIVTFVRPISDVTSIVVHNSSVMGTYITAEPSANVDLCILRVQSTVNSVGKITVTDSTIHPTNASASQSHMDVAVASFLSSVHNTSTEISFVSCRVQGAFSSQNGSSSSLAIVRFSNTMTLSHVNLLSLSGCSLNITEARRKTTDDGSTIEANLLQSYAQIENVELIRVEKSVFAVVVVVVVVVPSSSSGSSSSTNGPTVVMQPLMLNSSNRLSVRRVIFEDTDLTHQLHVVVASSSSSSSAEGSVVSLLFAALNMSARQIVSLTELTVRRVHAVVISSSSNNNVSAAVALLSFQKIEASSSSSSQSKNADEQNSDGASTNISLIDNSLVSQLPSLCAGSASSCSNTLREPACLLVLPAESIEEKNDQQTAASTTTTTIAELFNVSNNSVSANLAFVGAVSTTSTSALPSNRKTMPRLFSFENNRFLSLADSSTADVVKKRNIFQSLTAATIASTSSSTSPQPLLHHNFSGSSFEFFCNFWGSGTERHFDRIARPTATDIALHCLSTTASKTFSDNATESIFISRSSESISNSRTHTPTSTITVVVPPSRTISRTNSITRDVVVSKTVTPLQRRPEKTQSLSISATLKRKARPPPPPSRSEFVAALVTTSDVATYLTVGGIAGSSGALGARFRAVQGVMLGFAEGRCSSTSRRQVSSTPGDDHADNEHSNSSSSPLPPPVAAEPPPRSQSLFLFRIDGGNEYDAGTILSALLVSSIAFVALNLWQLFLVRFFLPSSENDHGTDDDDDDGNVHVSASSSIRRVIVDSSSLSGVVFFVTLYLDPCLSAAVTLPLSYLRQSSSSSSSAKTTSLLWAILGPVLVVGLILFPLCAAVFSKIFNRRDDHRDVFVVTEDDDDDEHQQSTAQRDPSSSLSAASCVMPLRKMFFWLFRPKGEWTFPISKDEREAKQQLKGKKQRKDDDEEEVLRRKTRSDQVGKFSVAHQKFQLAVPLIEPYTDSFKKFIVVDVAALLGFAAANILGEMLLDAKSSCVSKVVVMIVVLALYLIVVLYYRPFQERALRFFVPVMTALQLAALIVVLVTAGDNNNNNTSIAETLLLIAASVQGPLSFLMWIYFVAFLPQHTLVGRCAKKKDGERSSKSRKKRNNSNNPNGGEEEGDEEEELQRPLALNVVDSSGDDDDETRSSRARRRRGGRGGGGSARNKRASRRAAGATTAEQDSFSSPTRSPSASASWRRFQMNLSELVDGTAGAAHDDESRFVSDNDEEVGDGKKKEHGLQLLLCSPAGSERQGGGGGTQRSPRRRTNSGSSRALVEEGGGVELSPSQRRFAIDFELI